MLNKRGVDLAYDDDEALGPEALTTDMPASKLGPALALAVVLALSVGLWGLLGTLVLSLL